MTFRILIGAISILADVLKKYHDKDLVGVVFWGILMTCVVISLN